MSEAPVRERRARRRGAGLGSALAGAALLIVVGFALGVVAGLVLEQPDLVVDYLAGRTRTVELVPPDETDVAAHPPAAAAAAPAASEPAPAEPARAAPAAAEAAPEPAAVPAVREARAAPAARPEPAPPAAAAAAPPEPALAAPDAAGFAVQVGAFADAAAAEQLARRLRERGFPVYLAPAVGDGAARWRVRVGPLDDRDAARRMAERLEREERLGTWVLAEGLR